MAVAVMLGKWKSTFEHRVKFSDGSQGFVDCFWPVCGRAGTSGTCGVAWSYGSQPSHLSQESQLVVSSAAQAILDVRQRYLDADAHCTLAILYNPETMSPDLLKAHQHLDALVDKVFGRKFAPRAEVACVLTHGAARSRYADWFGLGVTSKDADEWSVEAVLTEAAKSNLVETATAATRQIPVVAIAALAEGTKGVTLWGCEPGFYYTLHGEAALTALPETGTAYGPALCGADGKVTFDAVKKPSASAGFSTIGVSETKGE